MWIDQASDGVSLAMDDKHARVTGLARQQGDPVATVAAIVGVALVIGVVCAVLARFHLSAPRPLLPQDPPSRPSTVEHGARPGLEPPAA
jgi:hypothetical protein